MTNSRGKNNCPSLIAIKSSRKPAVELFLVSELLLYAAVEGKDDTEPLKCQRVQRELLANCIKSSTSASPSWNNRNNRRNQRVALFHSTSTIQPSSPRFLARCGI